MFDHKQKNYENREKILIAIPIAIIIAYLCLPFYAKKALIHWFPTIDDLGIFEHATVHAPDSCWEWAVSEDYNSFQLSKEDSAYIDDMKTVSFLVIKMTVFCTRLIAEDGTTL